jgi:hypothetical protein
MVKTYNVEIRKKEFAKSNKVITNSFERRFQAVINELAQIQTRIEYLKEYQIELVARNKIFELSPHFMSWTRVSSWHDILLGFAKIHETRGKGKNLRNIPKLHEFVMNTWNQLYTNDFYRVLVNSEETLEEKVELNTQDEIEGLYSQFYKDQEAIILTILDFRDNRLAHITFKDFKIDFKLEEMEKLLKDTEYLLNIYAKNYNNSYSTVSAYSQKDHEIIFEKFK